jgi:hypothetical protein
VDGKMDETDNNGYYEDEEIFLKIYKYMKCISHFKIHKYIKYFTFGKILSND